MTEIIYIFSVSCKIVVNGKSISCKTWNSEDSYDDCYIKISNFIKENTQKNDIIEKHVLSANYSKRYLYTL